MNSKCPKCHGTMCRQDKIYLMNEYKPMELYHKLCYDSYISKYKTFPPKGVLYSNVGIEIPTFTDKLYVVKMETYYKQVMEKKAQNDEIERVRK